MHYLKKVVKIVTIFKLRNFISTHLIIVEIFKCKTKEVTTVIVLILLVPLFCANFHLSTFEKNVWWWRDNIFPPGRKLP